MPRGFESLADLVDLAHMGASSIGHDIGGGLAGIEELVRTRNAAKAAAAVRKIQEKSYRGSPGGQALAGSLPALADAFNPTHLLPREAQDELGTEGQRFHEMWDRVSSGAPAPAAALAGIAGVAGPGGEERSSLERALERIPGPQEPKFRRVYPSVREQQRSEFPGIYKDPRQIADEAEAQVGPQDPLLDRLFGVGRSDLASIADRAGNVPGRIPNAAVNPKGSEAASNIITPSNTRRLVNVLQAGQERAPQLMQGMKGWYVLDPLYQKLVGEFGEDEGKRRFDIMNHLMGMNSPNSPVTTEITRGTGANMALHQGDWQDWLRLGGLPAAERGMPGYEGVPGSVGHRMTTGPAMDAYLRSGAIQMDSPKVPPYIQASSVPDLGFQTDTPIGDAHFARGVGLADTRTSGPGKFAESVTTPELQTLRPWWQDVASQADLQAVPGQASAWGLFGPQTGVRTSLGAPKLELIAQQVGKAAERMGTTPEDALKRILAGQAHAGSIDPELLLLLGGGAGAAAGGAAIASQGASDGGH